MHLNDKTTMKIEDQCRKRRKNKVEFSSMLPLLYLKGRSLLDNQSRLGSLNMIFFFFFFIGLVAFHLKLWGHI